MNENDSGNMVRALLEIVEELRRLNVNIETIVSTRAQAVRVETVGTIATTSANY